MIPKVTVIIPVYNQETLITRALQSIPKRKDIEIIVIDDASTDDTWIKLIDFRSEYIELFYDILLFHNDKNLGVGLTVNRGYDTASGEYLVLLGSDDYFESSTFEDVIDTQLNGHDLVYFDLEINSGDIWKLTPSTKLQCCGSTKFMRREFVGNTRCPDKRFAEDADLYSQLLKKNPSEVFTGKVVKHYNYPRVGSLMYNVIHQKEVGEPNV